MCCRGLPSEDGGIAHCLDELLPDVEAPLLAEDVPLDEPFPLFAAPGFGKKYSAIHAWHRAKRPGTLRSF
jgi:hypothetical protein